MKRIGIVLSAGIALVILAACGGGTTAVSVKISAQTTIIAIDGRTQLSATVTGTGNNAVTWSTSNASLATVDSNGIVEANGAAGTVDITATSVADATKSDVVTITVGSFTVTSVTITAPSTSVQVGGTLQLSASVSPPSAPQSVFWSSSDSSVATIDATGKVTGVKAGSVTITAKSAANINVTDSVTITVVTSGGGNVTSVTINDPNPSGPDQVQVGGTINLFVTVVADPGVSKAVTWSSGDNSLATVDNNGIVTGVAAGTVTITATSAVDNSVSDSINIDVIAGTVTGVTITNRPPSDTLLVGVTRDLDATVTGTGNFSQDVTWTSSSPGVATIDPSGVITGVAQGTTVVKAVAASDTNQEDSFTLTVTQTSVDCNNPTALTSVNSTTTLPVACYSVAANGTVSVTAALTIQAGTIIEFGQSARLSVDFGGSLTANGSAAHPILMRGQNPSSGFWDGIDFVALSNDNQLSYVHISDAGSSSLAGVYVESTGSVAIDHTQISNSTVGLTAENNGVISSFALNAFSGNGLVADLYPMHLGSLDGASDYAGSSGTANTNNYLLVRSGNSGAGTWPATNAPFHVIDNATVTVNGAVSVDPGAQFEFGSSARLRIDSGGTFDATGTSSNHIGFSGASATSGFWDGIDVNTSTGNNLDYVDISDAGSSSLAGVYVESIGSVAISHSTFSDSTVGLTAENNGVISSFALNAFSGNGLVADLYPMHLGSLDGASDYAGSSGTANTNNYLLVRSGNSGAGTWPATNAPFHVIDNATVTVNGAVSVDPGAQFEFGSSARLRIDSGGTFNATGTSGNRITFQGVASTQGYWDGIDVNTSTGNNLDYVDISDGGSSGLADLYIQSIGAVTVHNSSFSNSSSYGIDMESGGSITPSTVADLTNVSIGNNTFSGNASGNTNGIP